jgi:hypothetical protein
VGSTFNMGGAPTPPYPLATFTGAITLGSDIKVTTSTRNTKITGAITGSHAIALLDTALGTFEIASSSNGSTTPNSVLAPPVKETAYDDDQSSTPITVNVNETAIVKGTYGDVDVNPGGVLKGTGTVGDVHLFGKVAPGLSPGCLTTGDFTFGSSSSYDFEVGGVTACTLYDQIKVTGTVDINDGATLNTVLYNGFKPTAGQKYVLVSNDGTDAITGTFTNAAQGATITVGAYQFSVSYTGGDGNDLELTALGTAPNTGFALIKNNPIVSLSLLGGAGIITLLIAKRGMKPVSRKR